MGWAHSDNNDSRTVRECPIAPAWGPSGPSAYSYVLVHGDRLGVWIQDRQWRHELRVAIGTGDFGKCTVCCACYTGGRHGRFRCYSRNAAETQVSSVSPEGGSLYEAGEGLGQHGWCGLRAGRVVDDDWRPSAQASTSMREYYMADWARGGNLRWMRKF